MADVEKYKEFLPWCKESRVLHVHKKGEKFDAELVIGFQLVEERYVSRVTLEKPHQINVSVISSKALSYLSNTWVFEKGPKEGETTVKFSVNFKFRHELHRRLVDIFFGIVYKTMVKVTKNGSFYIYSPLHFTQKQFFKGIHNSM